MKIRLPLVFLLLLVAVGLFAKELHSSRHIIGYVINEVKSGMNKIEIKMDSLDIFPTLDRILVFDPPESILGDTLIVDLDGVRHSFVFEMYTGSNYVLRANSQACPNMQHIELDWIPIKECIWLRHVSTNRVALINSGRLNEEDHRRVCGREVSKRECVTIRYLGKDGTERDVL